MLFKDITIREFQKSDSLDELTDLLHRSYKILADMNLKYVATYQDVSITKKRIDRGICFVAVNNEKIIGTVTYYSPENSVGSLWLEKERVAHFGQLGVEPDYRNKGIGSLLISHVEKFAQKQGVSELALDTAEPAKHLIDWYEKLGYRFIEHCQWKMTNYRSVIMSKKL